MNLAKNILFLFIIGLLFQGSSYSQEFRTFTYFDLNTENLKGSVKSIREYSYIATDTNGFIEKLEMGHNVNQEFPFEIHFDEKSNVISEKVSYGDTNYYTHFAYSYNQKNKISQIEIINSETNDKYIGYYLYDKKFNLISSGGINPKKHQNRYYSLKNPQTIREDELDTNGNVKLRFEHIYENGKKTGFRHYKNGFFYGKDKGDFRNTVKNTDSMLLLYKMQYDYDTKGNMIREIRTTVEWGFPPDTTFNTYNSLNQLIHSTQYNKNRQPFWIYNYQYDSNGNITKFEFIHEQDKVSEITSYNYTYDEKNNWIRKLIYDNGILTQIIERKIIYY